MLLTLQDDGVLRVYDSVDDAVRDVEALDAVDTFRAVFDESGEVYAIRWLRPNDHGRFPRAVVGNGEYTLVPEDRKDVPALLQVLREATVVEPREAESWVRDLAGRLAQ